MAMIELAISGAAGRMGRRLVALAGEQAASLRVVAAMDAARTRLVFRSQLPSDP